MPFDFVDKGRYDERYRYEEGALARERRRAENEKRIREHNQRRDARLLQITFDIVQQVATEADFSYLESNIVFWSNILLQVDANTASYFINNQSQLSIAISNHLQGILSKLQLKCFVFTDDFLSKSNLLSLFGFIQCQHVNTENSLFFNQFSIFVQKLKENEVLTRDEILCLHRMILDHQDSQDFIDKTLINLLRGSDTLAQLARRRIEQKVLNIDQSSFRQHFTRFKERVYQVPLNTETRETIEQVILVGIEKILSEKEQIIEHVQKNYGQLYLLHEKLPLHTDHVPQTSAGSFGTVLDDLLINFFAAFIIADSKGLLHIFCEKISQGFCFEGRTREALTWAALNSDIQSFDDTMAHYIHKEYLPYMMVMTEKSLEELMIESDVINSFIMKRHKNDSCIPHETYAPDGKITLYGVKRYLKNILFIEKEEDNRCIEEAKNSVDQRIDELLKNKNAPFRFLRSMTLIDYKIHALEDLKARLGSCALLSDVSVAAKEMEALYPKVNAGFFSKKTKELTDRFERYDDTLVLNR